MFTGIIRHRGTIASFNRQPDAAVISIETALATEVAEGDSLAVNGACLTVLEHNPKTITFRLMKETLDRTNLGQLEKESIVNLERPVAAGERFDGHFVLGHVDGVAKIAAIEEAGDDRIFVFEPPTDITKYLIPKGSIALDGVSLTIVEAHKQSFTVSIMPYTLEHTTFGQAKRGDHVNIEVDMVAKHVARLLQNDK